MELMPYSLPPSKSYRIVILIKSPIQLAKIRDNYVKALNKHGVNDDEILIVGFTPQGGKKDSVGWLVNNLDVILEKSKCKLLMVCDSKMYNYITEQTASTGHCSYESSKIFKYKVNCTPIVNYRAINYNLQLSKRMVDGLNSLVVAIAGLPKSLNVHDVKKAIYPISFNEIYAELKNLLHEPELGVDVEAFSLSHLKTGIGTISFSKHKDHAVCFSVQYVRKGEATSADTLRELLVWFFKTSNTKWVFHRAQYDIKILIYDLFMWRKGNNYAGFVEGMTAFKNFDDTMLMVYVCTNNTVQNVLNLKSNSMEFSGNYAIDIKNIKQHEPKVVKQYNARDTCNTMYVKDKYWDKLKKEGQIEAYEVLRKAVIPLVQADIHGISISIDEANKLDKKVSNELNEINEEILNLDCVKRFREYKTAKEVWDYNLKSKTKVKKLTNVLQDFNPNSNTQVGELIHEFLHLDVIDFTKTGLPSMTVDSITSLKNKLFPKD